ncbi:MAG: UbiA prenyltransferase family protein [Treponema sp.]|nr:UbiA prenyltransferase family protein [Treponema sp.]
MNKYVKIMRPDHWIKQLFIVPGSVAALLLTHTGANILNSDEGKSLLCRFVMGFISTCLVASANYSINEWLDAEFDRFHPTKKNRPAVTAGLKGSIVWALWGILSVLGLCTGFLVGRMFLISVAFLWFMGLLYNVKPVRTKDIPILDVLSESVNNAIRLLLGWFIISANTLPPVSIILGYWMCGAFLMATKRFAEFRMIGDAKLAKLYRKSFAYYTEKSLLISAFFYALCSVFFTGIFLLKYRIELILFIPAFMGLFCYYFYLAFKEDSAVQKPEKLYHEKKLMAYVFALIVLFIVLMIVPIPWLHWFITDELITIGGGA